MTELRTTEFSVCGDGAGSKNILQLPAHMGATILVLFKQFG
jgi:hypothetical protein